MGGGSGGAGGQGGNWGGKVGLYKVEMRSRDWVGGRWGEKELSAAPPLSILGLELSGED